MKNKPVLQDEALLRALRNKMLIWLTVFIIAMILGLILWMSPAFQAMMSVQGTKKADLPINEFLTILTAAVTVLISITFAMGVAATFEFSQQLKKQRQRLHSVPRS